MALGNWARGLAVFACATAIVSCGAKKEDEENAKNLQDGTWAKACLDKTAANLNLMEGDPEYNIETIKFDGTSFHFEMNQYAEATCVTQQMGFKMDGSYKAGADAAGAATTVEGASNIDISVTSLLLAVFDDNFLTMVNSADSGCGVTATKGVYFDPKNCSFWKKDDGSSNGPAVGAVWYSIFKATDTTLQWGDEDDTHKGTTPETRPIKLETATYAKK
jgi:hypothetical protein